MFFAILSGGAAIPGKSWDIPKGYVGEIRRTVAGARMPIDHSHSQPELVLVVRGSGSLTIGTTCYPLKAGTLVWLLPDSKHKLTRLPNLEMWVVSLDRSLLEEGWVDTLAKVPSHVLTGEEFIDLDRLCSQVSQDTDEPKTYNAGISYLVLRAWRASQESAPIQVRQMHPAVVRALSLLREGDGSTSLTTLARQAGVNAPYLSRLLVEHTGSSFVEWRNRIRLDRFIRSYRPGMNLLETATASGFGSYARFHHTFKELIGCSPSEWEKQTTAPLLPNIENIALPPQSEAGLPLDAAFSNRQHWLPLLSSVSPFVHDLVGDNFLPSLLVALPVHHRQMHVAVAKDAETMEQANRNVVASLRLTDPQRAESLAHLLATIDFEATHYGILSAYDLAADDLVDSLTALIGIAWASETRSSDPGPHPIIMLRHQTGEALHGHAIPKEPQQLADIAAALRIHFVIFYNALQAARASGDPRSLDLLSAAAAQFSTRAFHRIMSGLYLGGHGLAASKENAESNA